MNEEKPSIHRLARGAYGWLRASPLLTVFTYFVISSLDLATSLCRGPYDSCYGPFGFHVNAFLGIIGSGLWHLILLQYATNKESDFVRWHGRQAFLLAGIRTLAPISFLALDLLLDSSGGFFCWTIPVLIILWAQNTPWGNDQVKRGECVLAAYLKHDVSIPPEQIPAKPVESKISTDQNQSNNNIDESALGQNETGTPKEILIGILKNLKSENASDRMQALEDLKGIRFSSEAILLQLEYLAIHEKNEVVFREALAVLDLPAQRFILSKLSKIPKYDRSLILDEIKSWVERKLIEPRQADVIRKHYDFDITPPPAPHPIPYHPRRGLPMGEGVPVTEPEPVEAAPEAAPALAAEVKAAEPVPAVPTAPPAPRRTLLQTLLSETSIKIALYLGAFFVIASAIILGTLVASARLPILIVGTILFGGIALAIRKRLPQPSFALFIVFSFLLPITANVIEESLGLEGAVNAAYWVFVSALMALVWGGSTWMYESRLFSITSLAALTSALFRVGDIFGAGPEFFATMIGLSALAGLAGVWALLKWKDSKFSLPLFLAAQLLQLAALGYSLMLFGVRAFDPSAPILWHLASVFTWGLAFAFYASSDSLHRFFAFPWLAAGTLIPIPWFVGTALDLESFGATILLLGWGLILSIVSEVTHRAESTRKYSLPILLASIPTFALGVITGNTHSVTLGFITTLGIAIAYGVLHFIRSRGWLWALALLSFTLAYFAFFELPFMKTADVFFGYQLLGLSLIFLLPDLFLKNDLKLNWAWRLPPRIYGAIFALIDILVLAPIQSERRIESAIVLGVYALFFAVYALRYRQPVVGYISTVTLPLSLLHLLSHLEATYWLEALTSVSVAYFLIGFIRRKDETRQAWRTMLSISALTLGGIISFVGLFTLEDQGGWSIAVIGALFIVEMYSRNQSLFEIGAELLFPAALYLILRDLQLDEVAYVSSGFSLIWLTLDMIFVRTFKEKRPLELPLRLVGGLTLLISTLFLMVNTPPEQVAICFLIYTLFFAIYTLIQNKAVYGYIAAAYLPLTIFFALEYNLKLDGWPFILTALAVIYLLAGYSIRKNEDWSFMLRNSALGLGAVLSLGLSFTLHPFGGWYIAVIGFLFIAEMYSRKQGLMEIGVQLLFPAAVYLILRDFKQDEFVNILLGLSLTWLTLDLIFTRTFKGTRPVRFPARIAGGSATFLATFMLITLNDAGHAALCLGIFTVFFTVYTVVQRKAVFGYIPAGYLPLTILFALVHFNRDGWLPALTGLAVLYFVIGLAFRSKTDWSMVLRNSALALGTMLSLGALVTLEPSGGWYALVAGLLFAAEMYLRRNGWFEAGLPFMFSIGAFLILLDFKIEDATYHLLAYSLAWILTDMLAHLTFVHARALKWPVRGVGALLTLANYALLFLEGLTGDSTPAAISFGMYSLLFLAVSLVYRRPTLLYTFTLTLPLFATFLFREFDLTKWIHPVIVIAAAYYAVGYFFRRAKNPSGWDAPLLFSGLGLGLIVSAAAPILGGVDAAIPVALAATLWAVEAFARRNAWLGFPTNALYLLAYFIILFELKVDEPQFFSMGAALLGLLQHYFLTRAGSRTGAFITGMVSQLVLLGSTYIQMLNTEELIYFVVLFFQSIAVLAYGVVIRSRSLTFMPIGFVVLGVVTVIYSALKGISTVLLIGCTGIVLLVLGILAVVMRERITSLGERLSDWRE